MAGLDEIGRRHGTDKSSLIHDYLGFYESFLAPLREKPITILEVGVLDGASVATWEAYFPRAAIVGVDLDPTTRRFRRARVAIEIADQSDIAELTRIAVAHGPFDLVVEDGSHVWDHQITTLRTLFPFVRDGGFYIVEDLQTNYGALAAEFRGRAEFSCVEYLKRWLDLRVGDERAPIFEETDDFLRSYARSVQSMTFVRHACVIRKQEAVPRRRRATGAPIVAETGDVDARLMAHVSHRGDVAGHEGFVNRGLAIQGVEMSAPGVAFGYRVAAAGAAWGAWVESGGFAGTRGQGTSLAAVAVRLGEASRALFRVELHGRFLGADAVVTAGDGEELRSGDRPLVGLQIVLRRLAAPA